MRISTDQGKFYIGLFLAAFLALAGVALVYQGSKSFSPARTPTKDTHPSPSAGITAGAQNQKQHPDGSAPRIEQPKTKSSSTDSHGGEPKGQFVSDTDRPKQRLTEEFEDIELVRRLERGLERKLRKVRDRYDKPLEAARHLLDRRLPEGETELPFERYLEAMERMLDLPQYSTPEGRLMPSLREVRKASKQQSDAQYRDSQASLSGWASLGPGNVGGRTRALLIDPRNPDVMYAGATSGGVWKTTDAGRSWKPLTDLMANLAVNALAFEPNNPDVIYAGTGEGYFNADATRGAGIFRSFDGGNTWRRLEGTGNRNFYFVNDIVVSKNNRNRIYAATGTGVMRSVDGGVNWSQVILEERNNGCSDLAMRTDSTTDFIFAACGIPSNLMFPGNVQASIYRNDNAGALGGWDLVYTEAGMSRTSLAIAPSNQNVMYAVSSDNGATGNTPHSLHAVFRSDNGGATWNKVNDGSSNKLNASLFTNPLYAFLSECWPGQGANQFFAQGWFDNTIAVDPQNENIVWVGGIDLFRSDDGGANWGMASFWHELKTNPRYVHADQHTIVFHPQFNGGSNRVVFVGNDGGIFRSDNARAQTVTGNRAPCSSDLSRVTWTSLNNGYAVTQFYHGAAYSDGRRYLGGTQDNGVVAGADELGPNGWYEILGGDGGYVAVDYTNADIIYAENTGLSLQKSFNGGGKFTTATTGINNIGFGFIAPFVMDLSDPNRLWIGGAAMWRTKNGAETWTQASAPMKGKTITAIAVSQTDGNFVLAGTDQGYIHRTSIGIISNADIVWPDARPRTGTVSSLAFDPTNRDIAYATYSNFDGGKHVWRSVNGGASWQGIDGAAGSAGNAASDGVLPNIPVNCIVVDPTNPQRLYIGTDLGVFTSPDGGATWAVENTGFANVPIEWLTIGTFNGAAHLFAFTRGRGAWRVPLGRVCTYTLSAPAQAFEITGGTASVEVAVSSGDCQWTVENSNPWITVNSNPAMQGTGVVTFTVAPSNDPNPRSGVLTIAGKSFSVTQAGVAVSVSAASLVPGPLAPESLVAAFGAGMSDSTLIAGGSQLPLNLGGTVVKVRDSAGIERPSPLFFVSPTQINYLLPAGTATGPAMVTIVNGTDKFFNCQIQVQQVAPGFFTANGSGSGVAVGQALRFKSGLSNSPPQSEPLAMWDDSQIRYVARPIDLGPDLGSNSDQVFLVLYGTGMRFRSSMNGVSARLGGEVTNVLFVGAQGDFAGLDQVNIQIPRSLVGRGEVDLVLTVDGQQANVVRVSIK